MPAILLALVVVVMCVIFLIGSVQEYAKTRDRAYVMFFGMSLAVLTFVLWGFFHFKPWLN